MNINGILRPGINAGESILDLEVTRAQPYGLDIYFDNYTPPSIGAYSGRINGYVHNLTGLGDIANLNLQFTEGNRGLDLAYQIPLTASDTRIHFRYQFGKAKVIENNLERFDISSNFFTLESSISHPLYRSLNHFFSVEAQFAYRQIETSLGDRGVGFGLGDGVDGKTSVSVIRLIQNYSERSSQAVFSFRSTFNIGLDVFSATVNPGSLPDSQFFSWIGQFRYGYKLADNGSQLLLRGDVQFSAHHLLSLEQFALGGAYTIRGYRENYRVRDQAYVVSAELLYPLIQKTKKHDLALQIAPFVDVGSAWNYNQPNEATLLSVGIGLRSQWDWAEIDFYWAHPLTSPDQFADYDLQDEGIHFQLTAHVL